MKTIHHFTEIMMTSVMGTKEIYIPHYGSQSNSITQKQHFFLHFKSIKKVTAHTKLHHKGVNYILIKCRITIHYSTPITITITVIIIFMDEVDWMYVYMESVRLSVSLSSILWVSK